MIPIEFYVKFNLTGRVKPNSERKKEKTESMFSGAVSILSISLPKVDQTSKGKAQSYSASSTLSNRTRLNEIYSVLLFCVE
jgi:hypothetical protein